MVNGSSPKIPAMLRGDAFLYHGRDYPYANPNYPDPTKDMFVCTLWTAVYTSRLASKIKVYGTNAENPSTAPQ